MRRRITPLVFFLAVLAAVNFGPAVVRSTRDWVQYQFDRAAERRASRPPAALPIRAGDYDRYPISSFGFVLENWYGFRLDADRGTLTCKTITGRDTTIAFAFAPGELQRIYEKAIAIRLFEYPEPHPPRGDTLSVVAGAGIIHLTAHAGTSRIELRWKAGFPYSGSSDEWKRLYELLRMIGEIVEARPEYRAIPKMRYID